MRNKKMAKRIAVAMLAAATTFSSVPAAAVFAADTSVEASDAAWTDGQVDVTVDPDLKGTDETAKTIKDTLNGAEAGIDIETYYNFTNGAFNTKSNTKADLIAAIESKFTGSPKTYTVDAESIKVTDKNHWSFRLQKTGDADEVYNVSVVTTSSKTDLKDAAANTNAEKVYTLLQDYFASNTFYTYDNKSLTTNTVATNVTAGLNAKLTALGATITGDSTAVAADGTGTLTVTISGDTKSPYVYHFKAAVEKSSASEAAALQAAVETVEKNTYPSVASNDAAGLTALKAKIASDLKTAGFNGDVATVTGKLGNLNLVPATAQKDGKLIGIIDNQYPVDITLKYSSKDKDGDTTKSLTENFLKGRKSTDYTINGSTVPTYQFEAGSKLSNDVQKSTDIKPAEMADVIKAVQDGITAQLTTDKVADNGVTVSVTECKNAKNGSDKIESKKATANNEQGEYVLLVKTSIANDFYGYKANTNADAADVYDNTANDGGNANVEHQYIVIVKTRALKSNKATAVSVADQTVVQKKNYTSSLKADGTAASTDGVSVDVFDLKAVVSPETSNSQVTWTVTDKDGAATTDAFVTNHFGSNDASITKKDATEATYDGTTKLNATDGKLIVFKKGTYKVTASVDGKTATATFTVLDHFKDVRNGAYYETAVNKAYALGVTSGTSGDTFGVNADVTRAQFVTWLYNTAVAKDSTQAIADEDLKAAFSDVSTDKFYAKAVQWAVANKITSGTSATTFSPDQTITRAQAVTMLWKYVGKADTGALGSDDDNTKRFTDLPSNKVFAAAITWAVNKKVTSGTTLTTFSPDTTATRAQAITFINNAGLLD